MRIGQVASVPQLIVDNRAVVVNEAAFAVVRGSSWYLGRTGRKALPDFILLRQDAVAVRPHPR